MLLGFKGLSNYKLGDYNRAESYYRQAENIYLGEENNPNLAGVYTNLANLANARQQYDKAINLHQQARSIYQGNDDSLGISETYTNVGFVFSKQDKWPEALEAYQQAASYNSLLAEGYGVGAIIDLLNLSDAHRELADYPKARLFADSALTIATKDSLETPELVYTYLALAKVEQADSNFQSALGWLDKCLEANLPDLKEIAQNSPPEIETYRRYDYLFESIMIRADLLASTEATQPNNDPANAHYLSARELLSRHGRNLLSEEDRVQLARYRKRLAEAGIAHAFDKWESSGDQAWLETAFQFSEYAKAGVLREVLLGREVRDYAGIPSELQEREDSLRATLSVQRQLMIRGGELATTNTQILDTEEQLADLMATYESDYPVYTDLLSEEAPVRLSAVQFALGEDQVIQSYFSTSDQIYGFTISKREVSAWYEPIHSAGAGVSDLRKFSKNIVALRKGITRRLDRVYRAKAWQLYQQLFPESLPAGTQEVILSLDGDLLSVPFEALLTEEPTEGQPDSELPYLLRAHAISYTPSVSYYYSSSTVNRSADQQATGGLVAFAPVFLDSENKSSEQEADPTRAPLPATLDEVAQLDSLFSFSGQPSTIHLQQDATESQVYHQNFGQAKYLHFATHGFVDTDRPELSGISLYPGATSSEYDGQLTAGEIYHLRLQADLVVLSACETALGKLASGEGLLGLSRSFLNAGADNLVVSLWPVQDEATSSLMVDLYKLLLSDNNGRLSSQLRQAKLDFMSSEEWAHPYYWSAFVLIGG
ncbi:MAG: CHAT domain-containing tetratricopeptide repeat protein [Bacteroidota bacterium]